MNISMKQKQTHRYITAIYFELHHQNSDGLTDDHDKQMGGNGTSGRFYLLGFQNHCGW